MIETVFQWLGLIALYVLVVVILLFIITWIKESIYKQNYNSMKKRIDEINEQARTIKLIQWTIDNQPKTWSIDYYNMKKLANDLVELEQYRKSETND